MSFSLFADYADESFAFESFEALFASRELNNWIVPSVQSRAIQDHSLHQKDGTLETHF